MILKNLKAVLLVSACVAGLVSCKKDDETTEVLPSLEGNLTITAQNEAGEDVNFEFIAVESEESRTVTFIPKGVSHPEGGTISYSWTISPDMEDRETSSAEDGSYVYTFPDSLGTYTVTCSASASGYYSSSTSYYSTVVSQTESLTDMELDDPELGTFTDDRDGKTYKTTSKWGNYEWFCQNLSYSEDGRGTPYNNSEVMNDIFGRFYTWDEAKEICSNLTQNGGNEWRLPTRSDWDVLGKYFSAPDGSEDGSASDGDLTVWKGITSKLMTNAKFNGNEMWEYWTAVGDISNESGFSIIPTGYATVVNMTQGDNSQTQTVNRIWTFFGMNEYAGFWTSDAYSNENSSGTDEGTSDGGSGEGDAQTPSSAYYVYMYDTRPDLMLNYADGASFALPVRCVRDAQ